VVQWFRPFVIAVDRVFASEESITLSSITASFSWEVHINQAVQTTGERQACRQSDQCILTRGGRGSLLLHGIVTAEEEL
jgi:hypothetical protein